MDAVLFLKEKNRMFLSGVRYKRSDGCKACLGRNICLDICDNFEYRFPEYCVAVVEKWSRENPVKTLSDEFFEKFPNAPKDNSGCPPDVCPSDIGYIDLVDCVAYPHNPDCVRCWSRSVEDTTHEVN